MKHNIKIKISKNATSGGIIACRKITMREKILNHLLGCKRNVTILVPGDSVETVAITELPEEGETNEHS